MEKFTLESPNETPEKLGKQILANLSTSYSFDFNQILSNETLSADEIKRQFTLKLLEQKLKAYDENKESEEDESSDVKSSFLVEQTNRYLLGESGTVVEPNICVNKNNYEIIKKYRGREISDYVYSLTKRFENMSNSKSAGKLAAEMSVSSLVAVGVPMAVGVYKAFKLGVRGFQAIKAGITSIGMKTAIGVVVILLAELLLYLLLNKPEKVLGFILNNTDHNLYVNNWRSGLDSYNPASDLYMAHGEMVNFPEDNISGDLSKHTQICSRFEDDNPADSIIFGGIYFADRNFGFFGAEGIMLLRSDKDPGIIIAHQFSAPFSSDNGCSITDLSGSNASDLEKLYNNLVDRRLVHYEEDGARFKLASTVNSATGGVVGLIASIDQK